MNFSIPTGQNGIYAYTYTYLRLSILATDF